MRRTSRTREKPPGEELGHGFIQTTKYFPNGTSIEVTPTEEISPACPTKYSKMRDVVGNFDGFNAVDHVKIEGSPGRYPVDYWEEYTGLPIDPPCDGSGGYPTTQVRRVCKEQIASTDLLILLNREPVIPDSALQEAGLRAFKRATEQFPSDVSIGNFLIELREGIAGMLPKLGNILKLISSGFLSWEFGIKPFIDDLKKLSHAFEDAIKRLKFLRDRNFKKTVIHYSQNLKEGALAFSPVSEETIQSLAGPGDCFWRGQAYPKDVTVKFTAGVVILPKLIGLDDAIATLVAMLSTLGLNNPAKIAWNAIPWTWLVDWFVKIGDQLDDMAIQVFPGTIDVLDFWHSTTLETNYGIWHSSRSGCKSKWIMSETTSYKLHHYKRLPYLPLSADRSLWGSVGLNAKQIAILLALIGQRFS